MSEYPYGTLFHGKVVDMLFFPLIDTILPEWIPYYGGTKFTFFDPIFNIADTSISINLLKKKLGASACNILSNADADSGQEVFHLHVHILPRYADNPGISNMRGPISEDLDQVYSRITAKR